MNTFSATKAALFLILGAMVLLVAPRQSSAQKKYAAFIHGVTLGDDTRFSLNQKGSYMKGKGKTPAQWDSDGVIDGKVFLEYYDGDLYGSDSEEDETRRAMMERFVDKMKRKAPNADWVLVGHSQGGIVARLLNEHIRKYSNLNVEGVMTFASPMQGARIAELSYGGRKGYKNIKPIVSDLFYDIVDGPKSETETSLINFISFGRVGEAADYFVNNQKEDIDNNLRKLINESTVKVQSKKALGLDGSLIEKANSSKDPDNYVAYMGAERGPAGIRLSSANIEFETGEIGLLPSLGLLAFTSQYSGFGTFHLIKQVEGRNLSPGNEARIVKFFNDIKDTYSFWAEYYKWRRWALDPIGNIRFQAWRRGRKALNSASETHTRLIDAYKLVKRTREVIVCESHSKRISGASSESIGGASEDLFDPPSASQYVDQNLDDPDGPDGPGTDCHEELETYYKTIPNKNDGFLGTVYTTWDERRNGSSTPKLNDHNILYSDGPTGQYKREGTGFNHQEMFYNRRKYDSSNDPGVPDGAFEEGQRNPPTRDAANWIDDKIR